MNAAILESGDGAALTFPGHPESVRSFRQLARAAGPPNANHRNQVTAAHHDDR